MGDDDFIIRTSDDFNPDELEDKAELEGEYAARRLTSRTYLSRSFPMPTLAVPGREARFVTKVFDPELETELEMSEDGIEWLVRESPAGRVQVKLLVAGEAGHVTELWVERIDTSGQRARAQKVLSLRGEDARRFIELVRNLEFIPVAGNDTERIDDALVKDLFSSPSSVQQVYQRDPTVFRQLIAADASARDVVAIARRRQEVQRFRRLLSDSDFFEEEV